MKKILKVTALLILIFSFIIPANVLAVSNDSTPVIFADDNLKQAILDELGITGDTITIGDMKLLTELNAYNSSISDLSGLEYAINLQYLDLDYNSIENLAPIAGLSNLQTLYLDNNNISDITPLSTLINLTELTLNNHYDGENFNDITDLTPISNLTSLEYLFFHDNRVTNISCLSNLINLSTLWAYNNYIRDISVLDQLRKKGAFGLPDAVINIGRNLVDVDDETNITIINNIKNSGIIIDTELEYANYRLSGKNRFYTAVEISKAGWYNSENIILAYGRNFADALAGGPLAYALDAPILLTEKDSIPDVTLNEIKRLKAEKIYLLGGQAAISDSVESQLTKLGYEVERISGTSRFSTATAIGQKVLDMRSDSQLFQLHGEKTAFLVYSHNYPDALGVSSVASYAGIPILYNRYDSLDQATKKILIDNGIGAVNIIGGEKAVPESIETELTSMGIHSSRISGKNRYLTCLQIAKEFSGTGYFGIGSVIATGENFPDALAGGPFAAKMGYNIMLVKQNEINPDVLQWIEAPLYYFSSIVLGGQSAISSNLQELIENSRKSNSSSISDTKKVKIIDKNSDYGFSK